MTGIAFAAIMRPAQRTAAPLACPLPPLPAGPPILPMFACHVQPELAGKTTGMLLELDTLVRC